MIFSQSVASKAKTPHIGGIDKHICEPMK